MRSWWNARTPSERILLACGALIVFTALYFVFVVEPLGEARARHLTRLAAARALNTELAALGADAQALRARGDGRVPFDAGASILSLLNTTAARAGTQAHTRRITPLGPRGVTLSLDDVPFDRLTDWLVTLDLEHGVEVQRARIERVQPGTVDAQLTLHGRGNGAER